MALLNAYILLVSSIFLCSSGIILILESLGEMGQNDTINDMFIPHHIMPNTFEPLDTCTCDHGLVATTSEDDSCRCSYAVDRHDYVTLSVCTCDSNTNDICACGCR